MRYAQRWIGAWLGGIALMSAGSTLPRIGRSGAGRSGENGEEALVEATPEGYHEKGRFTPPGLPDRGTAKAWAYPAVANGRLYIRDVGSLWCYDVRGAR